jgi:hypothetical protein
VEEPVQEWPKAFNNISPLASLGDIIVGGGENISSVLPLGTENQILHVDSTSEFGISWKSYPWQLLQKVNVTSSIPAVVFTDIFDGSKFMHYKIAVNCCTKDPVYALLSIVFGTMVAGETFWETTATDYFSSLFDVRGNEVRYEKYNGTVGYMPLGHSTVNFRSYDGFFNGDISLWNVGVDGGRVQLMSEVNYLWHVPSGDGYVNEAGSGRYSSTFMNTGSINVNSVKIEAVSGNITGGNFSVYGIN